MKIVGAIREAAKTSAALGQTGVASYLIIYFVHKATAEAPIVSAREMTKQMKRACAKEQGEARADLQVFRKRRISAPILGYA